MTKACSPLRYPGGKQILSGVLATLIQLNDCEGGIYAEPYAGGCGAGLSLLFSEHISSLLINDADRSIYAFWWSILNETDAFLKLLRDTPRNVSAWDEQRRIYTNASGADLLELGFAAFYLNRCNRSGIIANGGVIGGRDQSGKWKIDARYNPKALSARVSRIALYRDRIKISNLDAIDFLRVKVSTPETVNRCFVYLDPPYHDKGSGLYLDYYNPEDHVALANYLKDEAEFVWVLTYDNVAAIRRLYAGLRRVCFSLSYSAKERRAGNELMVFHPDLRLPRGWSKRIPSDEITLAIG